jgi:hypothetical protein
MHKTMAQNMKKLFFLSFLIYFFSLMHAGRRRTCAGMARVPAWHAKMPWLEPCNQLVSHLI